MPKVQVLVGEGNHVLGTFYRGESTGDSGPAEIGLRAGPGQRIVEVELEDADAGLNAEELHKTIEAHHLR